MRMVPPFDKGKISGNIDLYFAVRGISGPHCESESVRLTCKYGNI